MDKRGFKQGAEFRYAFSPDSFGTIYGDYLKDHMQIDENVGGISRGWQSGEQRWSYYVNNQTTFSHGFYLRTDLAKVSDPWYFRDFSSSNYYLENYDPEHINRFKQVDFQGNESLGSLDSKARTVKEWNAVNLTTLVRYTDDFTVPSNSGTLQKYPEVALTAVRQRLLNTPLQYQFQTAYDYFYRQIGERGHLYQVDPTVLMPISLYGTSSIIPFVDYQGMYWDRDDSMSTSESSQGHHGVYSAGLLFNSELRRVFQADLGNIDKIQHTIRPEITYIYRSTEGDKTVPDFASPLPNEHSITYSLINVLTARSRQPDGGISYREWMRLKLAQTYYIKAPDTNTIPNNPYGPLYGDYVDNHILTGTNNSEIKPFSDVQIELDVSPLDYLSLSVRSFFNVYKGSWDQSNYSMNLKDDRGDILSTSYRYTVGTVEELDINLIAALRKNIYGIYVMRQDLRDNLAIEHTYGLRYQKQCWNVEVHYTETYDDHSYLLLVSLYGLGGGGGK
jgi:LPS-assembly protein